MTIRHPFENRFSEVWPPDRWYDVTVLLGCSGGADSVALLRAAHAVRLPGEGRLVVGHYHHGLRGDEADADQALVEQLCRNLGMPCEAGHRHLAQQTNGAADSSEAASRRARYQFLHETAQRVGARYVVTAHTADDQAETILHHILRGTGLAGLAGMRRARRLGPAVTLIRPLLEFRRKEVVEYLAALKQPFREDPSNRETRFTRNRIRHELLPELSRQYNPAVVNALLRLGGVAAEARQVIDGVVDQWIERCVNVDPNGWTTIDCRELAAQPQFIVREVLIAVWRDRGWAQQSMGFAKWEELASLVTTSPEAANRGQRIFPGAITARRDEDRLHLIPPAQQGR